MRGNYNVEALRGDVFGGLISAVVGLPLALAFGVASGLGAIAGLYGAVALGFFAAVFGGTRTLIAGPTGPMAVAFVAIVTHHADNLSEVFTVVVMAGLIQILLGVLRIGRFVSYTPHSVISGFMSGIGLILILMQTLPMLGAPVASGGAPGAVRAWRGAIGDFDAGALAVGAITLVVGAAWPARLRAFLPPAVAALVAGTLASVLWPTDMPVIGDVPGGVPELALPALSVDLVARSVAPALTLALLSSIDSLLTSLIADAMTRTRHKPNRELIGQGIGNTVCGFIGGLPGAGATPNTVVNIRAGARSPVAGALCAAILFGVVLGLGRYAAVIPHAVLAGILMKVGWDIIDWRFIRRLTHVQREHLLVMLLTLGLTVFLDVVTAVAIGLIAAGMAGARQFERLQLDSVVSVPLLDRTFLGDTGEEDPFAARVGLVALKGSFTVASSNMIIDRIGAEIGDHEVVILDFSETVHMDDSAAHMVGQMVDIARDEETACIVMGLAGAPATTMEGLDVLAHIPADQIVEDLDEAREAARRLIGA
ncbi:MAG: SulP family inorganic anion transporter [bacterium]|nr:SulP family inorganic anion transporter [bacterium]